MDWFSWLSKTALHPALVYEYGLEFARNELQAEDIPHFDHEFLQSMGISVAKHRLEILKVARKEASSRLSRPYSVLITAINRTKRSVGKYIGRLVPHKAIAVGDLHEPQEGARENRRVALTRKHGRDKVEFKDEKLVPYSHGSLALSGPLDGKFEHRYLTGARRSPRLLSGPLACPPNRRPTLSGPLDVKSHEKAILALRSPKFSGPLDQGSAVKRSPVLSGTADRWLVPSRSLKSSGPLDRATNRSPGVSCPVERAGPGRRSSPRVYGSLDEERNMADGYDDEHSLWAKLFLDMKPT